MKKKVILFNTHLDNIINAPDLLIEKLWYVLEFFKCHKEFVLWWRPHPLSIQTIQAMQPGIYNAYQQVVVEYKKADNVIYDDSSDLDRAIAVSDAYIGDHSSLVALYSSTGKPLLITEPLRLKKYYDKKCVFFKAAARWGCWLYFSAMEFNGCFRLNIETGVMEHLGIFTKELSGRGEYLHTKAFADGYNCWFIPQRGNAIAKLDLKTLAITEIDIPKDCVFDDERSKFAEILPYKDELILIPTNSNSIIFLHKKSDEIRLFNQWPKWMQSHFGCISAAVLDDSVWFFSENNGVFSLNLDNGKVKKSTLLIQEGQFSAMATDGENLWFSPGKGFCIAKWNPVIDCWTEISCDTLGFQSGEQKFYDICFYHKKMWLLPWSANMIITVETDTLQVSGIANSAFDVKTDIEQNSGVSLFYDGIADDSYLFIMYRHADSLLCIPKSEKIKVISLQVSDQRYEEALCSLKKRQCLSVLNCAGSQVTSDKIYTIEEFCKTVDDMHAPEFENKGSLSSENAGEKIWKHAKNQIR